MGYKHYSIEYIYENKVYSMTLYCSYFEAMCHTNRLGLSVSDIGEIIGIIPVTTELI